MGRRQRRAHRAIRDALAAGPQGDREREIVRCGEILHDEMVRLGADRETIGRTAAAFGHGLLAAGEIGEERVRAIGRPAPNAQSEGLALAHEFELELEISNCKRSIYRELVLVGQELERLDADEDSLERVAGAFDRLTDELGRALGLVEARGELRAAISVRTCDENGSHL
jgi:hypothetical protein